jgi:hypothetical protein
MATDIISKALTAMEIIVAAVLVSYYVGHNRGINEAGERVVERVDTLVVRDTITQYKPIVEERVVLQKYPVMVEKYDTIMRHDTIYLNMPREQVVWKDEYARVFASGIMPHVDSVQHFVTTRTITKEIPVKVVKKTRWGVGVQAGYGVMVGNDVRLAPYVGVGVSYNIVSW